MQSGPEGIRLPTLLDSIEHTFVGAMAEAIGLALPSEEPDDVSISEGSPVKSADLLTGAKLRARRKALG